MSAFVRSNGLLFAEQVPLTEIAEQFGTPCYVYSHSDLRDAFSAYADALGGRDATICYAVKANSNLAILNVFARLGAGFDIVSGGELARVIAAGGDPGKVVFSGVGKSRAEIRAALEAGIYCFNIESAAELDHVNAVAGDLGTQAPIAFRVNPDVDPKTHPYISTGLKTSKFGVPYAEALALYRRARKLPNLDIRGIACHIGSQLLDPAPAAEAAAKLVTLVDALAAEDVTLQHIDIGGGMGIRYRDEQVPAAADYLAPTLKALEGRPERLLLEPGRSMVGNAGVLLTRVEYLKHAEEKNFAVVDAAMNDLARPALYDAWHDIQAIARRVVQLGPYDILPSYDIVGPVCESGDFLGRGRQLDLREGDVLAIMSAGAYGMAMSSNYNTRPRAAEVIIDGAQSHLVRRRETIPELFDSETLLP
jgi:diaminopimelate decarboxylase